LSRNGIENKIIHNTGIRTRTYNTVEMESLLQAFKQIEIERRWWTPEIFINMENETLKRDVKAAFHIHNGFITDLAINGTTESMQNFSDTLHEEVPLVIISALRSFLDVLYQRELKDQPISHQNVMWYRTQGWEFPKFKFEELNDKKFKFEKEEELNDVSHAE